MATLKELGISVETRAGGSKLRPLSLSYASASKPTPKPQVLECGDSAASVSVFVGRMPFDVTDSQLARAIAAFRPDTCVISRNKRRKSKGFGFLTFSSMEDARQFVEQAHNAFLFDNQRLPLRAEMCKQPYQPTKDI